MSRPTRIPARFARRGSLRTQLIAWNIAVLTLLLIAFGVIARYTARSLMMASVNHELDRRTSHGPPPDELRGPPNGHGGHGGPGDHGGPDGFGGFGGPPDHRHGDGPEEGGNDHGPPSQTRFDGSAMQRLERGQTPPDPGNPRPRFDGDGGFDGGADPDRPPPPPDNDLYRPRHFDLQGRSLDRDGSQRTPWDAGAIAALRPGQKLFTDVVMDGQPLRVLTRPYPDRGPLRGVTQAPYPLTEVTRALGNLTLALVTLTPVGLLFAGLAGSYLTDRVLRRVRRLTQTAAHIGAHTFSERLPVTGNDEFSELADTFNGLLGRLESAYKQQEFLLLQQRRFTADASHELKTPLTRIKGNTSLLLGAPVSEADLRRSLEDIDRAAGSMTALVQDLLLLARSDEGYPLGDQTELLVGEILERAKSGLPPGDHAPIALQIADPGLTVWGRENDLVRLFANLLSNAVRYTPPDGSIMVVAERQGWQVVVRVADTGVGIGAEHLPHLGERFYRVDASRARPSGGTGLGLSICRSIVQAHSGTLRFESALGVGTTVWVTLPAPPDSVPPGDAMPGITLPGAARPTTGR